MPAVSENFQPALQAMGKSIPDLPYDLEREIFELTARIYPRTAPQLALVARRAQIWFLCS